MEVDAFESIEAEFLERVREQVWCAMTTVDRKGRPYSRIIHPFWESSTGWILTHRRSHKAKHLSANPHVALAYVRGNVQKPLYVSCSASWNDDLKQRRRVWNLVRNTPEPVGFDPANDFGTPENEEFGLLHLDPWRIVLVDFPAPSQDAGLRIWRCA